MPFRGPLLHFSDIVDAIFWIERYIDGLDFEAYERDVKTRDAVERRLQIVTEAIIRLGDTASTIRAQLGGSSGAGWEISCGMAITRLTTRLSGVSCITSCRC